MSEHDEQDYGARGWVARLGEDFVPRLASGLAMGVVAALFTFSGVTPFAVLALAVALFVSWEWGRLVHGPDAGILVAVQMGTVAVAGLLAAFLSAGLGLLALPIGAILAALLSLGRNSFFSAAGVFYAGFPTVAAIWLRSDAALGLQAVIFLILIVATADTAAFLCGRLIGGPLLSPRISPKKTWAGFIGALVASAVVGGFFWLAVPGGSAAHLAATGAALALVAQAGDLAESALKRRFGAKDAGSLLPGHGGVMDRVDGLLFAVSAAGLAAAAIDMYSPARALLLGS
jgi:phosphatidate cytidylyltransferase